MGVVVAPATPWGRSALAVVRLSGPGCHDVVARVVRPHQGTLAPGRRRRVDVRDEDGVFDDGVVWLGTAPHTFTGEDTAELTVHGNPRIVARLLDACVAAGARLAEPGAFTRRALVHGKVDLVRAEAVLQAIEARSDAGLQHARAGLDGRVTTALAGVRGRLVGAAAELVARLDVPDDDLALEDDAAVRSGLWAIATEAEGLAATARSGLVDVHGATVALVGTVNAGKSSLFNALLGRTRALVHDTPGTTRDVVEAVADVDGVEVTLLDTAGERTTVDPVEAAGLALAAELVDRADLVVVVVRAQVGGPDAATRRILDRTAGRSRVVVLNGVDAPHDPLPGAVPTVATTGVGVPDLRAAMVAALRGEEPGGTAVVLASRRQADRLRVAARCAREAADALEVAGPAVAADLVAEGLVALDEVTGARTPEDVLDEVFRRFCIGK